MDTSADKKDKGEQGELRFKEWMNCHNIPYWYIRQDLGTFSPALKKFFDAKRPDFMILLPNFGFILVDVKHKAVNAKYETFTFDAQEAASHSNLQRHFGLQIWYAASNENVAYKTWFWMHVSKVLEIGKTQRYQNKQSGAEFFAIPMTEFIQVADDDGLDRLFAKCLSD